MERKAAVLGGMPPAFPVLFKVTAMDTLKKDEVYRFFTGAVCFVSMDREERLLWVNDMFCQEAGIEDKAALMARAPGFRDFSASEPKSLADLAQGHTSPVDVELAFHKGSGETEMVHGFLSTATPSVTGGKKVWALYLMPGPLTPPPDERDSVTGLLKRRSHNRRCNDLALLDLKEGRYPFRASVYLNLTNFKLYNDRYGQGKGDLLLRKIGGTLSAFFPDSPIVRLSSDHFGFIAPKEGIKEKIILAANEIRRYLPDPSIDVKIGLRIVPLPDGECLSGTHLHLLGAAKMAADSIKNDARTIMAVYTRAMEEAYENRVFVITHFREALKKEYIRPYFQPLVRTLNGKISGFEVLARWKDPEKGLLPPSLFIPILEERKLIPLLDQYMVRRAACHYRKMKDQGRPIVPVSINFSRIDFDEMDVAGFLEGIVKDRRIPRSYFHVEITESALSLDEEKLGREISRLREAGYQCWLDDFGSGYSSFHALHHFDFDVIKIDMAFQKNRNEKSQKILESIILTAKALGIHTVAEGVESENQAEALKAMGCEGIQGYFYGKPLPYEECSHHCQRRGLTPESSREALILDKAGLVNVLSDTPISLLLDDGYRTWPLLTNAAFKQVIQGLGEEAEVPSDQPVTPVDMPFGYQIRSLLDRAIESRKKESLTFVALGQYMKARAELIASIPGLHALRLEMFNITFSQGFEDTHYLDSIFRNMLLLYDGFYVYDQDRDRILVVESLFSHWRPGDALSMADWMKVKEFIHPDDRERFVHFMSLKSLYGKTSVSNRATTAGLFRVRRGDGNYRLAEINVIRMDGKERKRFLFCVKDSLFEHSKDREKTLALYAHCYGFDLPRPVTGNGPMEGLLLQTLKEHSSLKFFWKDRNRRFLGASKAFLSYYGFTDEKAILGKTDEDMGWHLDNHLFWDTENRVLSEGYISRDEAGICIIRGKPHHIRATKFPVYQGNRIIGLVGYFIDMENHHEVGADVDSTQLVDSTTGLLSARGLLVTGLAYDRNYRENGENYGAIMLYASGYGEFLRKYGKEAAADLLHRLTGFIINRFGQDASFAFLGSGRFLIFTKLSDPAEIDKRIRKLYDDFYGIHEAAGCPVTLFLIYAIARGSEANDPDEVIHILHGRIQTLIREKYETRAIRGTHLTFDRRIYDNVPTPVIIRKPDTDELLYANGAALKALGYRSEKKYVRPDTTCTEFFHLQGAAPNALPWHVPLPAGRLTITTYHGSASGKDYRLFQTLTLWQGEPCHFIMAQDIKAERAARKEAGLMKQEAALNEAIELGLSEASPARGIEKILARTGTIMGADRVVLFENKGNGTLHITGEWCRDGVPSCQRFIGTISAESVQFLYDRFGPQGTVTINDPDQAFLNEDRKSPLIPGLRKFIAGRLEMAGQPLGFLEIMNPSPMTLRNAGLLIGTLSRFLSIMIRSRDNLQVLDNLSLLDPMTKVRNRRALSLYLKGLPKGKRLSFLFGDMNGLKSINDHKGHEAGDRALLTLTAILAEKAGADHVFRMGGDEFLTILEDLDEKETQEAAGELQKELQKNHISMALGIITGTTPLESLDDILAKADRRMYRDKKKEEHRRM